MDLSSSVFWLSSAANTVQLQLTIHILMNGSVAQFDPFSGQKNSHTAVAQNSSKLMIDFLDLMTDFFLFLAVFRFSPFQIIVICVGIDLHPSQEPPQSELLFMGFYEPICH